MASKSISDSSTVSINSQASSVESNVSSITSPTHFQEEDRQQKSRVGNCKRSKSKKKASLTDYVFRDVPLPMPDDLIPTEKQSVKEVVKRMMDDDKLMEVVIPAEVRPGLIQANTLYQDAFERVERMADSIREISSEEFNFEVSRRQPSLLKKGSDVRAVGHKDVWERIQEEKHDLNSFMKRVGEVFWLPYYSHGEWMSKAKARWQKLYKVTLQLPKQNSQNNVSSDFDSVALKALRDKLKLKINSHLSQVYSAKMLLTKRADSIAYVIRPPEGGKAYTIYAQRKKKVELEHLPVH